MSKQTDIKTKKNSTVLSSDSGFLYSFIVIAVLFASVLFSIILSVINSQNKVDSDVTTIISYIIGPIAILSAIGILRYKNKVEVIPLFSENSFSPFIIIATVLIFLGLTYGLSEVNVYFISFLQSLGLSVSTPTLPINTPLNVIFVIIAVCVMPAIMEEVAFRGLILKGLKGCGEAFAVLVTGGLFAIFHMSPAQTVYQFIVGCVYSLIVIKGGNILLVILAHFINNLYIVLNYYYFNITFEGTAKVVIIIIGVICFVAGLIMLLTRKSGLVIDNKLKKQNKVNFILGAVMGIVASIFMWIQGLM